MTTNDKDGGSERSRIRELQAIKHKFLPASYDLSTNFFTVQYLTDARDIILNIQYGHAPLCFL